MKDQGMVKEKEEEERLEDTGITEILREEEDEEGRRGRSGAIRG